MLGRKVDMNILKIIKRVYILYTIYIILSIGTTSLNLVDLLPGVLIMWIFYFFFTLGYKNIKRNKKTKFNDSVADNWLIKQKKSKLFFIGLFSIVLSILAVRFYTGQTPASIIQNLINGRSLYIEYQNYFRINQIGVFSLTKIPFIGMLICVKFILIYSYLSFGLFKSKLYSFDKFYLILITIPTIYFGVARGTSFEFFELLILISLITYSKLKSKETPFVVSKKTILLFFLACIMIFVFYSGISARGIELNYRVSRDIYYNPNGILPNISMFLSEVVVLLFSYFGFGFFYISKFVSDIWLTSLENFIGGFIPLGISGFSSQPITNQMQILIDMGARWHPDVAIIINSWGFIGLLIFSFAIGMFSSYLKKQFDLGFKNIIVYITYYFILLQMISLPIGNFVRVSSANSFIVTILLIIWSWRILRLPRVSLVKHHQKINL